MFGFPATHIILIVVTHIFRCHSSNVIICIFSLLSVSSECSSSTRYVQLYIQPARCQAIRILCECTCMDWLVLLSAVRVPCQRSYVVGWVRANSVIWVAVNVCFISNQTLIEHHVRSKLYLLQFKFSNICYSLWEMGWPCSLLIIFSLMSTDALKARGDNSYFLCKIF